jgi:hypothetical protein
MRPHPIRTLLALALGLLAFPLLAAPITKSMHHLRHGAQREWDDFPARAESDRLRLTFDARASDTEQTLSLRHRDLRHAWKVTLNDRALATLPQDENPMRSLIAVPPKTLRDGKNVLLIESSDTQPQPDDVLIGDIEILDLPRKDLVSQATLDVTVTGAANEGPVPCRLTIVDARGDLVPLGVESDLTHAVRTGVVYTASGRATLRLPAGAYTLYASRGFEWSVSSQKVDLQQGKNPAVNLTLAREVDTSNYVAADTHIHTFTYSRHGDATLAERMVTLAGEGIELPIATDHNLAVDYEEAARAAGVRKYFTPVIGDEVTTPRLGHFNVFPVDKSAKLINFRAPTWDKLFDDIDARAPGAVVILNHARDDHGGFRPFDPARHISLTGEDLDGSRLRVCAMEVINSGAILNDPLMLYRDWMGCLNRGLRLSPVGASDSHDVTRFIVGQGRTYVRADDRDVSRIDVKQAVESFKHGHVLVSYGLLVDMKVNARFTPGDLATVAGDIDVEIHVAGPSWTRADHVALYANGVCIRQADIDAAHDARAGLKASLVWRLPKSAHDVYLTALATGPGLTAAFWPGAKPYQSTGEHWTPAAFACTAPIYLDADGDGVFQSAFDYARQIVTGAHDDVPAILNSLANYDASAAAQVASILHADGQLKAQDLLAVSQKASPTIQAAFKSFVQSLPRKEK